MLASGFSHEMNTPLATVLTCVEGILREAQSGNGNPDSGPYIAQNAAIARDQVLRCRGITQHFLRLSRGQASPGEVVELNAVIEAVTRLVQPTAQAKGVQIEVGFLEPGTRVRAGEAELQHTLVNLLINAIEACGSGDSVRVEVDDTDPVRIRVSDEGCGIPPDQLDRIFEPFVSLRTGGTGLGLFLSLNFVRQWGGEITVRSAPGHGSTFEITLPSVGREARSKESIS
jgi:signal transduction histidine kinase